MSLSETMFRDRPNFRACVPMTHAGVGTAALLAAMSEARATPLGIDWRTCLVDTATRVRPGIALQGNFDPEVLLTGLGAVQQTAGARG
jgi:uroporphyrinogen decarboxylase